MKRIIEKFGIGHRILSGVAVAVVAATLGAIITVHHLADKNRVQEIRHNMSSLLAQSEVMIENMDALHRAAAFDQTHLVERAKVQAGGKPLLETYGKTDLYQTIPVVAAWLAVAEAAKRDGYEFLTPSRPGVPARNPKNNNGADFAAAFQAFASGQPEYFSENKQTGELVLARPVHLNRSCLSCHGDPANSPTKDGKDILGFPMEGAQVGDLKGAFVLKAQMSGDPVVKATVNSMTVVGGIILVIVLTAFHLMNQHLLIKPLRVVIGQLHAGAERTGSTIQHINAASGSLAESASEQAASLEETSASLEEISSMTKHNAENAANGTTLGRQTREATDLGHQRLEEMSRTLTVIKSAVGEMQAAVGEMQSSSQEISKIIKIINEIAFQTNLLALNAAVEAARAGEAGAGFAVVADEVRALAQRSAQAAKDTAEKIEAAAKRSEFGGIASARVVESLSEVQNTAASLEEVFQGIAAQIKSLDDVIAGIATASKEQSHGVAEVNLAVSQMDKITQSNAASAEENAGAAEELTGQAAALQGIVVQLQKVITGEKPQALAGSARPLLPPLPSIKPGARRRTAEPRAPESELVGANTGGYESF